MVMPMYKDKCTSKCVSPSAIEAMTSRNHALTWFFFTSTFYFYNMGLHGSMSDLGRCKSNQNWLLCNFRGFRVGLTASDKEKSLHKTHRK